MGLPRINVNDIADLYLRRNFEALFGFLKQESPLLGFRFFTITFTAPQTGLKYPHNLGFRPQDIILTSQTGPGSVTFNYGSFDATNLNLTVSGPITASSPQVIRFLAGTYQGGAS